MADEELIERLLYGVCQDQHDDVEIYETEQLMKKAAERIRSLHEQLSAARRDADEAEAYAAELEQRTKWQPIETAPKEAGAEFLVWHKTWAYPTVACFDNLYESYYSPVGGDELYPQPTHWMPLPEPPHA